MYPSESALAQSTIDAIDNDPLFAGSDPQLVQSLGSATMGLLISALMPYLKAALLKYLQDGIAKPSPVQVLATAQRFAEVDK